MPALPLLLHAQSIGSISMTKTLGAPATTAVRSLRTLSPCFPVPADSTPTWVSGWNDEQWPPDQRAWTSPLERDIDSGCRSPITASQPGSYATMTVSRIVSRTLRVNVLSIARALQPIASWARKEDGPFIRASAIGDFISSEQTLMVMQ